MDIITNPFTGYEMATVRIGEYTLTLRVQTVPARGLAATESALVAAALRAAAALVDEHARESHPLTITVCCPETAQRLQQARPGSLLAEFRLRSILVAPKPASERDLVRRYALYFEKHAADQRWQR